MGCDTEQPIFLVLAGVRSQAEAETEAIRSAVFAFRLPFGCQALVFKQQKLTLAARGTVLILL